MGMEDMPQDSYFWRHVARHFFGDKANMEDMPEDAYWHFVRSHRWSRRFDETSETMEDMPQDAYFWHHVRRFVFGDKADMEDAPESADWRRKYGTRRVCKFRWGQRWCFW